MAQTPEDAWSVPTSRHSLALLAGVAIVVVALVAAVVALTESGPSSAVLIPVATTPLPARALPQPTTTTAPAQSVPTPTTTLKPGDSGPQVKILQRELKALGYPIAAIDGSYGPQTSRAVAAFQRASHLTADGIVGAKTLQALSP